MNQVLMRSTNTSISSVLPVITLLMIGSSVLGAYVERVDRVAHWHADGNVLVGICGVANLPC